MRSLAIIQINVSEDVQGCVDKWVNRRSGIHLAWKWNFELFNFLFMKSPSRMKEAQIWQDLFGGSAEAKEWPHVRGSHKTSVQEPGNQQKSLFWQYMVQLIVAVWFLIFNSPMQIMALHDFLSFCFLIFAFDYMLYWVPKDSNGKKGKNLFKMY